MALRSSSSNPPHNQDLPTPLQHHKPSIQQQQQHKVPYGQHHYDVVLCLVDLTNCNPKECEGCNKKGHNKKVIFIHISNMYKTYLHQKGKQNHLT
jgi:hypothetical protein